MKRIICLLIAVITILAFLASCAEKVAEDPTTTPEATPVTEDDCEITEDKIIFVSDGNPDNTQLDGYGQDLQIGVAVMKSIREYRNEDVYIAATMAIRPKTEHVNESFVYNGKTVEQYYYIWMAYKGANTEEEEKAAQAYATAMSECEVWYRAKEGGVAVRNKLIKEEILRLEQEGLKIIENSGEETCLCLCFLTPDQIWEFPGDPDFMYEIY